MHMAPKIPVHSAAPALLALVSCLLLLGTTILRNRAYRDPLTLWSGAVQSSPEKARPRYNLGNVLRDRGDMAGAVREWKRAVEIDPGYSMAYNQLGTASFLSGSLTDAEKYYHLAAVSEPNNAEAHYNLALVLDALGRTEEAIYQYDQFVGRGTGQSVAALRHAAERLQALRGR